jgi:hypothetical protein
MPLSYNIDKARCLVITDASGVVTAQEALAHQRHLDADPDFDESFDQLVDFLDATEIRATGKDVRLLAERSVFSKTSKRAVVAKDPLTFGLARMFGAYRSAAGGVKRCRTWVGRSSSSINRDGIILN